MFTVKHITESLLGGAPVHNLYAAERVTFQNEPSNVGALELRNGDTLVAALWGGRAYVMNEKGQTVSSYELPEKALDQCSASCQQGVHISGAAWDGNVGGLARTL